MTIYRFNPSNPIPNEPFYFPQSESLSSSSGPLIVGSGINIDYATGTISATGGGGGGVVSVSVVSPVTNTGTGTNPVIGVQVANTFQRGVVQIGPNIQETGGVIGVLSASTLQAGVVRLNDSTNSSSNLEALTANQGRNLQNQIDAITISGSTTLVGTFNASIAQVVTVTSAGATAGFVAGNNLLPPASAITDYYVLVTTGGTYTPPGSVTSYNAIPGDWFLCDGTSWLYLDLGQSVPYATETAPGIIEIATSSEVQTGTDTTRAVTPATVTGVFIKNSALSAKGSLIGASAAGTPEDVAIGAEGSILTVCNACTTGVTWTPLPPNNAIPCALLTDKGQLVGASSSGTPAAISKGAAGQFLTACDACNNGVYWSVPADIPCSLLTGKGQLVAASDLATPTALPVGTEGQILTVCSSNPSGLAWVTSSVPADIPCSLLTEKGQLVAASDANTPTALSVGTEGQILTVCSSNPSGLAWVTSSASGGIPCSTFTAAQQLLTSSAASTPSALSVGDDGCILTVSGGTIGWSSNTAIPCALLTAKGQIVAASGTGAPVAIPYPGINCQILVSCTTAPSGWASISAGFVQCSCYNGKGGILVACGAGGSFGRLTVGANGSRLTACDTVPMGVAWVTGPYPVQTYCPDFQIGSGSAAVLQINSADGLVAGCYAITMSGFIQTDIGTASLGCFCIITWDDVNGGVCQQSPPIQYQTGGSSRTPWSTSWALPVGPNCSIRLFMCSLVAGPTNYGSFATAMPL